MLNTQLIVHNFILLNVWMYINKWCVTVRTGSFLAFAVQTSSCESSMVCDWKTSSIGWFALWDILDYRTYCRYRISCNQLMTDAESSKFCLKRWWMLWASISARELCSIIRLNTGYLKRKSLQHLIEKLNQAVRRKLIKDSYISPARA